MSRKTLTVKQKFARWFDSWATTVAYMAYDRNVEGLEQRVRLAYLAGHDAGKRAERKRLMAWFGRSRQAPAGRTG